MKEFESCRTEKIVVSDDLNIDKVKSLFEKAQARKEFWDKKYNTKYDFLVVEGYYEIIKELLTALMNIEGMKSSNHECLVAFFKEKFKEYGYEAAAIDTLRAVRNAIDYRGVYADKDYLKNNKLEFEHIIKLLMKLVKERAK